MEKFEFYNPVRVVFGPGEVKKVGVEAKALGSTALVVSYKEHAFFADLLARIEKDFAAAGAETGHLLRGSRPTRPSSRWRPAWRRRRRQGSTWSSVSAGAARWMLRR